MSGFALKSVLPLLLLTPAISAREYQVTAPPASMKLDPFYQKYVDAHGYPIVSSAKVSDYALKEAAYLVDLMLAERPDVRKVMVAGGSRLVVMAHDEYTTDIPEQKNMKPKDYWDARARGLGGSRRTPLCSCAEENLLAFRGDPYHQENILIHEFAHNIHLRGLVKVDLTFDGRLKAAYETAMKAGLWKGVYASTNKNEYWAEAVQSWFNNNREPDHDHNHVNTRNELREYDPRVAALCAEVFGTTELVYTKPQTRLTGHLKGYDPGQSPVFRWPRRLIQAKRDILKDARARNQQANKSPKLVEVKRIWNKAPHNAFTDLMRHQGRWYCVFREGRRHVSPDGKLRVITSTDGNDWNSLALIDHPTDDLRDAKISLTPDGRLMLNGAGMQADKPIRYHSMVWFSSDGGRTWDRGRRIGDPDFWLWRVHWKNKAAYSFGYSTNRDRNRRTMKLYSSPDGESYKALIEKVNVPNGVGEDRILFLKDGSALCLLRRETGSKTGLLGKSMPPFRKWTWKETNLRIGGPNMIQLPDGRLLACTRLYQPKPRTSLSWVDPQTGTLTECLRLPSGGDTSYPGMVLHDGLLWISYYSSHEDKTSIYLARVRL